MSKKLLTWIVLTLIFLIIGVILSLSFGWLSAIPGLIASAIAWPVLGKLLDKARDTTADVLIESAGGYFKDGLSTSAAPIVSDLEQLPNIAVSPTHWLRSFEDSDKDNFIHLVPGSSPGNLPKAIATWKAQIEATDSTQAFRIALLSGRSGCGKSSLMKAGIIPRLSADKVIAVYIEASPTDTEQDLLAALRQKCPDLTPKQTIQATLHQKDLIPAGKKILIILDQFEQYLHARNLEGHDGLLAAFRECDGVHVQSILMIREDFVTPACRFIDRLEINQSTGTHLVSVDLMNKEHAKRVLGLFGRALAKVPLSGPLGDEINKFLDQTINDLAENGFVVCVQLALFAQMVQGEDWTPITLKRIGGASGVVAVFLEKTFVASTAPPDYRRHENAARAVLASLLPEAGSRIKGEKRSEEELRQQSGYSGAPAAFKDLIRLLDNELHLITPVEPGPSESSTTESTVASAGAPTVKYYRLTHDYLVASMREWINRELTETPHGKAQLLVTKRAAMWRDMPDNRLLPGLIDSFKIWKYTRRHWTTDQRSMMKRAFMVYSIKALIAVGVTSVVISVGFLLYRYFHAQSLASNLVTADIAKVPEIVNDLKEHPFWANLALKGEDTRSDLDPKQLLHLQLAHLAMNDPTQRESIYHHLLSCDPAEFSVLRRALEPPNKDLIANLWDIVRSSAHSDQQRLRAAAALASYDPNNEQWRSHISGVVNDLVRIPELQELPTWIDSFRPIAMLLTEPLTSVYQDFERTELERVIAAQILVDYTVSKPDALADLLLGADERQFPIVFPALKRLSKSTTEILVAELNKQLASDASEDTEEDFAKRQANAAIALLVLNKSERVWQLLTTTPHPTVRSFIIQRLGTFGVDAAKIVQRLSIEQDNSNKRALILSLGQCAVPNNDTTEQVTTMLIDLFAQSDDPGLRGASEWLLRKWKQDKLLASMNEHQIDKESEKIESIRTKFSAITAPAHPANDALWYVNSQGQTMVVLRGPITVKCGSPATEKGREQSGVGNIETLHEKTIPRCFAISAKVVTVKEYRRFDPAVKSGSVYAPQIDCPINGVSWYEAAGYCNWLSQQENLEPVYDIVRKEDQSEPEMKLTDNYLARTGYRLPTEAEWECACRAGTITSHYFGAGEDLLGKYAWYTKDSQDRWMLEVGHLKPNDLGLFDMLGNAWQWCEDKSDDYLNENDIEDPNDILRITNDDYRMVRGGSFTYPAWNDRCASRGKYPPKTQNNNITFRVARTFK